MKRAIKLIRISGKQALMQAALLAGTFCAWAAEELDIQHLMDGLSARLEAAATPADSIPLIYDIYDLSPISARMDNIRTLYGVATRAGNQDVQLDMLRQWANYGSANYNDSIVAEALALVNTLPDSEDQRQTRTYILACQGSAHKFSSDTERDQFMRQQLKLCMDMTDTTDPYERVAELFKLIYGMYYVSQGQLMSEYLGMLDKALSALPRLPHNNYLRAKFNNIAAQCYWYNDEVNKSINADRSQLINLDHKQKDYLTAGRFYANLDQVRYMCLRRLLRCYEYLSATDVKDYTGQLMQLADRNPEIAADLTKRPSPRLASLVKEEKYDEALPLARELAYSVRTIYDKHLFFSQLIDIAQKAGNREELTRAEAVHDTIMDNLYYPHKANERVRELELLYDVNTARRMQTNAQLRREHSRTVALYSAGAIVMALMLVFAVLYFRYRNRSHRLESELKAAGQRNSQLEAAGNELAAMREKACRAEAEKAQLAAYIGHEMMTPLNTIVDYSQMILENLHDNDPGNYLRRFASIVEVNSRILQEVANDVQECTVLDARRIPIRRVPVNANALADICVESIKPQLAAGTTIALDPTLVADRTITTDPRRVQIALLSCISNIAKLASEGAITLSVAINRDNHTCSFIVTHTGLPSSTEEYEKIFASWDTASTRTSCTDAEAPATPSSAMIISALGGTLAVDATYPGPGVRFAMTIPIN